MWRDVPRLRRHFERETRYEIVWLQSVWTDYHGCGHRRCTDAFGGGRSCPIERPVCRLRRRMVRHWNGLAVGWPDRAHPLQGRIQGQSERLEPQAEAGL